MVLCTYCNKEYKTKYTLKAHQKRPSCLKNKSSTVEPIVYDCKICEKVLSNKQSLQRHNDVCKVKKEIIIKTYDELKSENIALKEEIKSLKKINKKLSKRPTTIINNDNRKINIIVKNYIKNSPENVTLETIKQYIPKLTLNHILNGGDGYAKFF